jgi:hypothetical protein
MGAPADVVKIGFSAIALLRSPDALDFESSDVVSL